MIELEIFNEDQEIHGCGYWSVCLEHDCPCHPDANVSKGFNIDVYNKLAAEMASMLPDPEYYDEFDDEYYDEYDDDYMDEEDW